MSCDERPHPPSHGFWYTPVQITAMLFKALSAAVYGIDANLIDVEVDYSGVVAEKDVFHTVGLPDAAVRESRDRVRAAIKNSGYTIPPTHITINLAPADLKKEGSGFDLPIAVGILGAYGALRVDNVARFLLVGELGLDGSVRAVPGMLPVAILAREKNIPNLILPAANAPEAAVVEGVNVYPCRSLLDVLELLNLGSGRHPARTIPCRHRSPADRTAALPRRLQGRAGTADGQARAGSGRRGKPQHSHDRAARARAKQCSPSGCPSILRAADVRGGARDDQDSLRRRRAGRRRGPGHPRGRSARRTTPSPMPA